MNSADENRSECGIRARKGADAVHTQADYDRARLHMAIRRNHEQLQAISDSLEDCADLVENLASAPEYEAVASRIRDYAVEIDMLVMQLIMNPAGWRRDR